jgi:hypothetical protein
MGYPYGLPLLKKSAKKERILDRSFLADFFIGTHEKMLHYRLLYFYKKMISLQLLCMTQLRLKHYIWQILLPMRLCINFITCIKFIKIMNQHFIAGSITITYSHPYPSMDLSLVIPLGK